METHWEHFPHQADMGVRGYGATKAQAFEQAALAMVAVMLDPALVAPSEEITVSCEAPDDELLLTDWLNALIFEMAVHHKVFGRFEVMIDDHALTARAWGEALAPGRHAPSVEIKGATFTSLAVKPVDDGWLAQCVVDV